MAAPRDPRKSRSTPGALDPLDGLRSRWTVAFLFGELIGFLPPALVGASLSAAHAPDLLLVLGLTVAGAFEGASIGWTQSRVLRRYAPSINSHAWIAATAIAAAFAWLVGMGGGALMGASQGFSAILFGCLVPLWITALLGMGFTQWLVMRKEVRASFSWVWVSGAAWLVGVMIPVVALTLAPNSWPPAVHIADGVAAAVAMGAVVGLITGQRLRRLLASPAPGSRVGGALQPDARRITS